MMLAAALLTLVLGGARPVPGPSAPSPSSATDQSLDATEAEMMLDLLRTCARGFVSPAQVDAILATPGMHLIIDQQNISRVVSPDQYRTLLRALGQDSAPTILPVDGGERARRGVEGLQRDVWPALRWGCTHTGVIAQRIAAVEALDVSAAAQRLAARFLPDPVPLHASLHIVAGGRAGAATVEGDAIYFDVLATSYGVERDGVPYPSPSEIVEFFAHELHHVGLSQIIDRTRRSLKLDTRQARAYAFLSGIVMEGSASYLINGHADLGAMRHDPLYAHNLEDSDQLLRTCEQVVRGVLDGTLDGDAYERAVRPLTGMGDHAAGALMLDAINRAGGITAVMGVLRDPRKLLITYDESAARLTRPSARLPLIDRPLAARVSMMGQ